MFNLKKIKYNDKIVTRVILLVVFLLVFVIFPYKLFIGSVSIRFLEKDYCNFKGFHGYSNLEVFPENPSEIGEVTDYIYIDMDTWMDPTCKIYMECVFEDAEKFKQECNRLSQISVEKYEGVTLHTADKIHEIHYSEELFHYPAYIACYNYNSCDEYALIIEEEQKIIYVYLQGASMKVDEEYMPVKKDDTNKITSIYQFNGYARFKYREL